MQSCRAAPSIAAGNGTASAAGHPLPSQTAAVSRTRLSASFALVLANAGIDLKHWPALEGRKGFVFVAVARAICYVYRERQALTMGSEFPGRFAVDMKRKPSGRH